MKENRTFALWQKILALVCALILVALSFGAGWLTRSFTQDKRVGAYSWALELIERNYFGDFDADAASERSLAALAGMLDEYSAYYTAEEYAALVRENAGERSGIGVAYSFLSGKGALIASVVGNSPACHAGLKAGDTIVGGAATDGERVEFLQSSDFSGFLNARGTGEFFTLYTLAGESYTLAKAVYQASYVTMSTSESAWGFVSSADGTGLAVVEDGRKAMRFLPDGTAYVKISQFYGTAADEFGALMDKFTETGCTSLILDLRGNGGGYVSVMQDMAGYFTSTVSSSAVAMKAVYKDGSEEVFPCYPHVGNPVPEGTKISVLANAGTASASEALIGVLVSYGLLDYENIFLSDYSEEYLAWVGTGAKTGRTYGKGIMQSTYVNPSSGDALKLTTAQIYWQNGRCIHGTGLTAQDGCTLVPAAWSVTSDDQELQQAVAIIASRT